MSNMHLDMSFSEQYDTSIDEYFTYPISPPEKAFLEEEVAFDFEGWQDQVRVESLAGHLSHESSLNVSTSPSLRSDTAPSPNDEVVLLNSNNNNALTFRLTWPDDGQNKTRSNHAKKPVSHSVHRRSHSSTSTTSAEDTMPVDPHHEGSCAKCRMTEVEARKCRLERRREQNRASQRKFRARKEAKIKEAAGQVSTLETYVDFLEKHNGDLEATNADLRQQITNLQETQKTRSKTRTDLISGDGSTTTPHPTSVPLSTLKKTSGMKAISAAQQHASDLYMPLFDHELEPQHHYSNQR